MLLVANPTAWLKKLIAQHLGLRRITVKYTAGVPLPPYPLLQGEGKTTATALSSSPLRVSARLGRGVGTERD